MTAFYNEIDPFAAQWLRNLSEKGLIASGTVNERSIRDLEESEFCDATQMHFFAGIGAWSYALRLAGWPDDAPVWTGSCPCQPFSQAGQRGGFDDDRHLWPDWFRLIREWKPPVVFGEQVASPDGLRWFDLVSSDLEGAGYSVGAADLCAAGVGAPHIRQRLYFVAVAAKPGWIARWRASEELRADGDTSQRNDADRRGADGGMGDADGSRRSQRQTQRGEQAAGREAPERAGRARPWSDCEWIDCLDAKRRPVEPGTFPLAHGAPSRVGRLRAYGNAINPYQAAVFIRAVMETLQTQELGQEVGTGDPEHKTGPR